MKSTVQPQLLQSLQGRRETVANHWYRAIARTGFAPFPAAEVRRRLVALTDQAIALLLAESFERGDAQALGTALVQLHYTQPEALGRTLEVLTRQLTEGLGADEIVGLQPRLAVLLGELAAGFAVQARETVLAEQEQIRGALFAERERVMNALRESEANLAEAQRIAQVGSWEWDIIQNEVHWSDEIYRIFGLTPQEFGATLEAFQNYIHPDEREFVDRSARAAFGGGQFSFDHRIVRPDGEIRFVHQQGECLLNAVGMPARMIGTVQDITDRKALEEHQYIQKFLAMVSHDLRQPLTILLGHVQLLAQRTEGKLSEAEQRSLLTIGDTAQRIHRLSDDIRDAAHIGANRFEIQPSPIDLATVLRQIVDQQQSTTTRHTLTIEAPEHLEGSWDHDRISQLYTNLISNAIKYSPEGGAVRVILCRSGNEAVVEISDRGVGFSPEYQQFLFQPFSRLDQKQIKGTGLGLYISRAIAEAHGGRIWVESEEHEGTTFSVALPLTSLVHSRGVQLNADPTPALPASREGALRPPASGEGA